MTRFVNVRATAKKERESKGRKQGKRNEDERGRWTRKRGRYFLSSQANRPEPEEFSCSLTRRYSTFVNFQDEYSRNI